MTIFEMEQLKTAAPGNQQKITKIFEAERRNILVKALPFFY
jgi:hypothetical protein